MGMPPGEKSCEDTQAFATARYSRADSSDRDVYDRRGFVVSHPFQSNEEDCRSLLLRQFGEGALQIAKLQMRNLVRRQPSVVGGISAIRYWLARALPGGRDWYGDCAGWWTARPKIGAFFAQVHLPEGVPKAILHELVSGADIARQGARITRKTGDQGFDFPVKACGDRSPFRPGELRTRVTGAVLRFCKWVVNFRIHHPASALVICRVPDWKLATSHRRREWSQVKIGKSS
jgi:hypothetical protein